MSCVVSSVCVFFRIQSVPATVIYFTIYDNTKYALGYSEADSNTKYIPVFAGTSARGECSLLTFSSWYYVTACGLLFVTLSVWVTSRDACLCGLGLPYSGLYDQLLYASTGLNRRAGGI